MCMSMNILFVCAWIMCICVCEYTVCECLEYAYTCMSVNELCMCACLQVVYVHVCMRIAHESRQRTKREEEI